MHLLHDFFSTFGLAHPLSAIGVLIGASLLVLWRVEAMLDRGLEGTALGTIVLPYCSGLGNLLFVVLMLRDGGEPHEVVINSVVNNATNLTLLLGLPALVWGLVVVPTKLSTGRARKPSRRARAGGAQLEQRLSRLSLLLTLFAVGFFTGAMWLLGQDGRLDHWDGAALIGLFLFWQCFQVFDALKNNLRRNVDLGPAFVFDVLVVLAGAWLLYESLEWIVAWLSSSQHGFFRAAHLGWITGWLLVLPNALVAVFYAVRGRADIVYSSQVGDGHICIPFCVGLCAVFRPIVLPPMFAAGLWLLLAAAAVHLIGLTVFGRLPKPIALGLVGAYGWFVYAGMLA